MQRSHTQQSKSRVYLQAINAVPHSLSFQHIFALNTKNRQCGFLLDTTYSKPNQRSGL